MKLSDKKRYEMFELARSLDASLGDIFQNECELSLSDFRNEMINIHNLEARIADYRRRLLDISGVCDG